MLNRDNQKWMLLKHPKGLSSCIFLDVKLHPMAAFSTLSIEKTDPNKRTVTVQVKPEPNEPSAQLHNRLTTAINIPAWSETIISNQHWIDTEATEQGSESLKNYIDLFRSIEDIDDEAYAHLLFFAGHPSILIDRALEPTLIDRALPYIPLLSRQPEDKFSDAKDMIFKYQQFYGLGTQIAFHLSLQYAIYTYSMTRQAKKTIDPTSEIELDKHCRDTRITLDNKIYDLCKELTAYSESAEILFAALYYAKALENQTDTDEIFAFLEENEKNRRFFLTWNLVKKFNTALIVDYKNYDLSKKMLKAISRHNPNFNLARENLFGTYTLSLQNLEKNSEEYDNITDDLLDDALTAGDPHHIDAAIMLGLGDDILAEPKKFVSTDAKEKSILISATAFKSLLNRVRAAEKQPKSEAPDSMSTFKV